MEQIFHCFFISRNGVFIVKDISPLYSRFCSTKEAARLQRRGFVSCDLGRLILRRPVFTLSPLSLKGVLVFSADSA